MSKIDELIRDLCPHGVAYKHIWEVTAWDKKFNAVDNTKQLKTCKYTYLLASALRKLAIEGGNVKLLSTGGEDYGWTTEELAGKNISEGEIVAIPWGGKATVQYYNGKFVTADNRIATSLDKNYLDNKFLYYFMLSNLRVIQSFYRGSGIQHPSMAKVLGMKIPIPPLEVQKEIISILDKFTQLEAELSAELSAELEGRRKQYEYYRKQLLSYGKEEVEWTKLMDIAHIGTGSSNTNEGLEAGEYPFFVRSQIVRYKNEYEFDETAIITSGDGVGVGKIFHFINGKYALHQRAYRISIFDESVMPRFFYYYMRETFEKYILGSAVHSSVTSVRRPMLNKYLVPIPRLEEQQRVVTIMDRFDKLAHDVADGIPAEISARHIQYEYYRTKLLTFQEAV